MRAIFTLALTFASTAALAVPDDIQVPEMSAGAGVASVLLLAGVAVLMREKTKR